MYRSILELCSKWKGVNFTPYDNKSSLQNVHLDDILQKCNLSWKNVLAVPSGLNIYSKRSHIVSMLC